MGASKRVSIVLEGTPPTVNHYWSYHGVRRFLTKRAVIFRKDVEIACRAHRIEGRLAVTIDYHPPDRRKRDIDNIIKPILDALQHAGLFDDDFQIQKITATRHDVQDGGVVVILVEAVD